MLGAYAAGGLLLALFLAWERRAPEPMLPLGFFRSRAVGATNAVSLAMYFEIFGVDASCPRCGWGPSCWAAGP